VNPDDEEDRYGGVEADLGDGLQITVTTTFAENLDHARRLAYYLGEPTVLPVHLAHMILASQERQGSSPALTSNQTDRRSRALFDVLTPDTELLPASPPRWTLLEAVMLPVYLLVVAAQWTARRAARIGIAVIMLALIGGTVGVHNSYAGKNIATTLAENLPALTATLDQPGVRPTPIVLLGPLSDYYVMPRVTGIANQAKEAMQPKTPSTLIDWYAFVARGGHSRTSGASTVVYLGQRYAGITVCAGQLSQITCVVIAQLVPGAVPNTAKWTFEHLTGSPGVLTNKALVVADARGLPRIDEATLTGQAIAGSTTDQLQLFVRDDVAGTGMLAATPVVLAGHSNNLPLLGMAFGKEPDRDIVVMDISIITTVVQGIANRRVGPLSGAVAYAGLHLDTAPAAGGHGSAAHVIHAEFGAAADMAGIVDDDLITAADGVPVHSGDALVSIIRQRAPGSTIVLSVLRKGIPRTVSVVLDYAPLGAKR
jgi:PDZ domain-containing protein